MNRKISFAVGEYYHIYARGNNRREIFNNDRDRWRFLVLLYVANHSGEIHLSDHAGAKTPELFNLPADRKLVDIGAYCLMPNHFHLLIKEKNEGGISKFMQKLLTSYSMYFNKRYDQTGGVFERPFKAQYVDDDAYLKYLYAYIHLNPVKITDPEAWAGKKIKNKRSAKNFLEVYRFSSYQFYLGDKRLEDKILEISDFPEYFRCQGDTLTLGAGENMTDRELFEDFMADWLEYHSDDLKR